MTACLVERMTRPGSALFCGPHGQRSSRDALEHRLAKHPAAATITCPSLTAKHVAMHALRYTATTLTEEAAQRLATFAAEHLPRLRRLTGRRPNDGDCPINGVSGVFC